MQTVLSSPVVSGQLTQDEIAFKLKELERNFLREENLFGRVSLVSTLRKGRIATEIKNWLKELKPRIDLEDWLKQHNIPESSFRDYRKIYGDRERIFKKAGEQGLTVPDPSSFDGSCSEYVTDPNCMTITQARVIYNQIHKIGQNSGGSTRTNKNKARAAELEKKDADLKKKAAALAIKEAELKLLQEDTVKAPSPFLKAKGLMRTATGEVVKLPPEAPVAFPAAPEAPDLGEVAEAPPEAPVASPEAPEAPVAAPELPKDLLVPNGENILNLQGKFILKGDMNIEIIDSMLGNGEAKFEINIVSKDGTIAIFEVSESVIE